MSVIEQYEKSYLLELWYRLRRYIAGKGSNTARCPEDCSSVACNSTPTVLTVSVDTWHDKSCVLLLLLLLSLLFIYFLLLL